MSARALRLTAPALALVAVLAATWVGVVRDAEDASAHARPDRSSASSRTALIKIGPGAALSGYTTRQVTLARGGRLKVSNRDSMAHTVTSVGRGSDGKPLFDTVVDPGQTTVVRGAGGLAPGRYPFFCRFHPFMRGTLTVTGSGPGHTPTRTRFRQPLAVPRVITSAHPRLVVRRAPVRVLPTGPKTMMWTYGGSYPGPTLRRPAGADTTVTFADALPASSGGISVHLHGDHHSSADDGQPTTHLIEPGSSRTYHYPLTDRGRPTRSTLDFYHDHRMMLTGRNNWRGLQGMVEITSPAQDRLDLPRGDHDVPLMISDRTFDAHNQLVDPFAHEQPVPDDGVTGQQVLVDGRFAPYLDVSAGRYRLRMLNSSNFTSYDLELSDGRGFEQVGNGDGLFVHPVHRQDILLGPAQTADVVVDFAADRGRHVVLRSVPRVANPDHGTGTPRTPLMQFRVDRSTTTTGPVPRTLRAPDHFRAPRQVSFRWVLGTTSGSGSGVGMSGMDMSGEQWTINGLPFDPDRVDVSVPLGAKRTWEITNQTTVTHYVHLHEEQWHTVSRDGGRPPPWERGLEDTWRLDPGESVVVAARFTDYTGRFMIHCHMLEHEDHGMMAQFEVTPP